MPNWIAKQFLPSDTIYKSVDFELYGKVSRSIFRYLREETLRVEEFSIDEAFCEISGLPQLYKKTSVEYALCLQQNIMKKFGIPVSIGIANTRIKAKIFSEIHKPFGVFAEYESGTPTEMFQKLPIADIPFVGKNSQKRFAYRAETIADFLGIGFWQLKKEVGKNMTTLWLELS